MLKDIFDEKYPIREDWKEYYDVLEGIRRTGVCNMWGANVYLKEFCPELSENDAKGILCNWIHNYNELSEKYGWRNRRLHKMNRDEMLRDLAGWIVSLKESAREDEAISIAWFNGTKNYPFSIIAGWEQGFDETMADVVCISKADPCYAMCVKVAINEGPYAYTDFELMNMPFDEEGIVDDTCVALEWEDNSYEAANFFLGEWERIMKEHGEEV